MLPPVHKMRQQVESIPDYPGRAQVEAVTGPLVEFVAGKWVRRYAERQVLRLVGYHEVWHALAAQGCKMPGREMVRRGIVRGGKTSYSAALTVLHLRAWR